MLNFAIFLLRNYLVKSRFISAVLKTEIKNNKKNHGKRKKSSEFLPLTLIFIFLEKEVYLIIFLQKLVSRNKVNQKHLLRQEVQLH